MAPENSGLDIVVLLPPPPTWGMGVWFAILSGMTFFLIYRKHQLEKCLNIATWTHCGIVSQPKTFDV